MVGILRAARIAGPGAPTTATAGYAGVMLAKIFGLAIAMILAFSAALIGTTFSVI